MIAQSMVGLFKTKMGHGNLHLCETPIPIPNDDEVLLEIKACGICGTDIHIKNDEFPYYPPVILGHEFAGDIIEIGKNVKGLCIGDRVVGEPHTKSCGKCELCRNGYIQICEQKRSPGWGINGAFAKYMLMPNPYLLHKIPDSISYIEGAVIEPAVNVVQDVVIRPGLEPNDTVLIFGPGPIGLLAAMVARACGAGKIYIVGTKADLKIRLPIAEQIGVDAILLSDQDDVVNEIMQLTKFRGVDLVIEASGATSAIRDSIECVKRTGRISQIGLTGKKMIEFPWDKASWKIATVFFNLSTAYAGWDRTIGLVDTHKIDLNKVISHIMPLEHWQQAFENIESKNALKTILIP